LLPLKDNIPTRHFPVVTVVLIVINLIVYFAFQEGGLEVGNQERVIEYAFIPHELSNPDEHCVLAGCGTDQQLENEGFDPSGQPSTYLTILFAMFMHGGLIHLGGNMLFLWIFGNNIEDAMGRLKFLAFYLLGGLAATLAQYASDTDSVIPTLGASGAIAAVLGGYALLYPRARVLTLVFIVIFITVLRLPALLVLGLWFALQFLELGAQTVGDQGGVAYWAHIGGFAFGLVAVKLFAGRYNPNYEQHDRIPVY
jgi:membrane associated rhomboid family serine protease